MPNQIPTPAQVIQIARISQYLAQNDIDQSQNYNGKPVDQRHGKILSLERFGLEWAYNRNNADPTLIATAAWVYSLCIPYDQAAQNIVSQSQAAAPTITGPGNQTLLVGQTANFTVVVASTIPYTLQWFRNGVLIVGATSATYTLPNVQLTDSGSTFYAIATSTSGSIQSGTGLLTVTAPLGGSYYYGDVDYSAALMSGTDAVPYVGTFGITHSQPLVVPFGTGAANNKWEVVKYPIGEGVKTIFSNPPLNNGVIPSSVYYAIITIGSFLYIASRSAISLQGSNPTVTFS